MHEMAEEIRAHFIIELMGRPPEHLKEALNTLVVKIGSEKGVSLLGKKYHKAKPVKDVKNLYTNFAEINMEFDSLERFFAIITGYMPSNIEIYEPEKFKLNAYEINALGNQIISRLHGYDEITKRVLAERDILLRQLQHIKSGGKIEDLTTNFVKPQESKLFKAPKTKKKKPAKASSTKKKK